MRKYNFNPQPPREALNYFRAKGIKPGFDYREVWREEHATAFTVAKAMKIDILETIRDELDKTLAEGRTYQDFKKDLTPTLQKLGWWGKQDVEDPITGEIVEAQLGSPRRLKTIYQVNTRTARAAGQWQRAQRTKRSHPYLLYELGPSREHRPEHAKWHGLLLPIDDPFWQTHMPTNGYGCKCRVRQVSRREYDRLVKTGKYLTKAPEIKTREWTNKRTGEVLQVPEGIDPGFDSNPGAVAREHHAAQVLGTKLKTARPEVGALAMQSATDFVRDGLSSNYRRWISEISQGIRQANGESQLVTTISAKLINQVQKTGRKLDTAAVTLQGRDVQSLVKADLPQADLENLVQLLTSPNAILLNPDNQELVYVVSLADGGTARLNVALANGAGVAVRPNALRSGGVVEAKDVEGQVAAGELILVRGSL